MSWTTDTPGRLINFHLAASEEKRTIGTHIVEQRSEVKSPGNEKGSRMFGIFNLIIHSPNYYSVVETLSGAGEI